MAFKLSSARPTTSKGQRRPLTWRCEACDGFDGHLRTPICSRRRSTRNKNRNRNELTSHHAAEHRHSSSRAVQNVTHALPAETWDRLSPDSTPRNGRVPLFQRLSTRFGLMRVSGGATCLFPAASLDLKLDSLPTSIFTDELCRQRCLFLGACICIGVCCRGPHAGRAETPEARANGRSGAVVSLPAPGAQGPQTWEPSFVFAIFGSLLSTGWTCLSRPLPRG